MKYVIAYDIGTTGVKTCLFKLDKKIELIEAASSGYPLFILPNGGAEQDPNDWWDEMCVTTKEIFKKVKNVKPSDIEGISFCSQAQGVVLVDKAGKPVRRAMSYMDQRATEEVKKGISHGIQIAGANIFKLIPSLIITGAVTSSAKDPVWKYKWVEAHEPQVFSKVYKFLDVKDYLILRCTGEFTRTEDSAFATLIYDNRPKKRCWSKKMCKMFGINMDHLPRIIGSTDLAGLLTEKAAKELGLTKGVKVFGGGGDNSLIGIGAGCTNVGDTHIYCGTSGWVNTVVNKRIVDTSAMIAAITGAQKNTFNYFAEMETAGKCFEWVRDHLALDEIDIYLNKIHIEDATNRDNYEGKRITLFEHLNNTIKDVPPGSNGVIFAPWLHGNRCPFEDPYATGMFYGIKITTGKTDLIRAVLEGIFYHLRWMLECQEKKIVTSKTIRFVGGGALSPIACQMLSNILGRTIETIEYPYNVGAIGAAAVCGVGLGEIGKFHQISSFIPITATYKPDMHVHKEYEPYYQVFKNLHKPNKKNFKELALKSAVDKTKARREKIRALKFLLVSLSAGIIQLASTAIVAGILEGSGQKVIAPAVAASVGLVLSVIWNFTINRKFTFKSAVSIPKAMALAFLFYVFFFPAQLFATAYLTNGSVWGLITIAHVGDSGFGFTMLATVICMVFNFVLEFFWQKFVVFRNSIDSNKQIKK